MSREQHRVTWPEPRALSPEELAEYEGYVRTEQGVASPDCFTAEELAEAEAKGRRLVSGKPDPLTPKPKAQQPERRGRRVPVSNGRITTLGGMHYDNPKIHEIGRSGQPRDFLILTKQERAKGFVRPFHTYYWHPSCPAFAEQAPKLQHLRDWVSSDEPYLIARAMDELANILPGLRLGRPILEDDGRDPRHRLADDQLRDLGRHFREPADQLLSGEQGGPTEMVREIAETLAREPGFYSTMYCRWCKRMVPVSELRWPDDSPVGS